MKVLIVEDDPMVMRLNTEYLGRIGGMECVARCSDVPSALAALGRDRIDLVLLDIYLKGDNGLSIISYLRERRFDTDVILITAASELEIVREARGLGVSDYLVKPFSFERFRAAVESCRRRRETMARLPQRVGQEEIDGVFGASQAETALAASFPKGITASTLELVSKAILPLADRGFLMEDVLAVTAMSRVSIRKYLKYLVACGVLGESFQYGQVGRPSFTYRCLNREKLERLASGEVASVSVSSPDHAAR